MEGYRSDGLIERWGFRLLWSHEEGSIYNRIKIAVTSWVSLIGSLLCRKVSFLHIHTAMYGSFWRKSVYSQTARLFNVPVIMHLHGSEMKTFYNSTSPRVQKLISYLIENSNCVIVLSSSWKDFVKRIAPKANVQVVNNYVSIPSDVLFEVEQGKFDVLFLGIVGPRKGTYDLLHAWSLIVKQLPNAKLYIGGNGDIDQAKKLAEQLGIKNQVEFLGWVSGDDKLRYLKSADVFVLPSYNEGLPMSVLEAMAWQKPVVTTKVGGIPELIIDSCDGLLIDPGNIKQLSDAILKLHNNLDFRVKIAKKAREKVINDYSRVTILPKLENIYSNITK